MFRPHASMKAVGQIGHMKMKLAGVQWLIGEIMVYLSSILFFRGLVLRVFKHIKWKICN